MEEVLRIGRKDLAVKLSRFQHDISQQNKRALHQFTEGMTQLKTKLVESVGRVEKQISDDATSGGLLLEALKQIQSEQLDMITQMKTDMDENASAVEDKIENMKTQLTQTRVSGTKESSRLI